MDIITRKQAIQQGLTHYYTGKPCKHGHLAVRYVSVRSCVKCQAEHRDNFAFANPEKSRSYSREWVRRARAADPAKYKQIEQRRVRPRTDELREKEAARRLANQEHRRAWYSSWSAARRQTDPQYRLRCVLVNRVSNAVRKQLGTKAAKTTALIGCSVPELMAHLESQFVPGMTWEGHGRNGWHIDHIRPCASFDLTDPQQQRECFHWTNLQPLWAFANISKGAKLVA
jgi:hypothetical protein